MKKLFTAITFILLTVSSAWAGGTAIVDVNNGIYLRMVSTDIQVTVENQAAVVKARQTFKNTFSTQKDVKYGFPLPEGASASQLQFKVNWQWYKAKFAAVPQDTSLPGPGGEVDFNLKKHLGETPLYYNIDYPVQADSLLNVELTYVQLLPYSFGMVDFSFKNDYRYIQIYPIESLTFQFSLSSDRTINHIELLDLVPDSLSSDENSAFVSFAVYEDIPKYNFNVQYELSAEELGLFSMTTFMPDTTVLPDQHG